MFGIDSLTIVLILALAFVLWVAFSPDKLANTLRARFKGAKARAADALDDAIDRMEAAEADTENQIAKANQALIEIKTERKSIGNKVAVEQASQTKWQTAAENAASVQREDLVKEALTRKQEATEALVGLEKQLQFLLGKEAEVQKAVNALNTRKVTLKRQKIEVKTRAKTAKTTLSVNELLAGIDLTGRSKDVERAYELVEAVEAKSGAMAEIAETVIVEQRMDEELERLSTPQVDIDAEVQVLMAQFQNPPADSAS